MSIEFSYDQYKHIEGTRLTVRNGLDQNAKDEIVNGNYDLLYLLYGNFTEMAELNLERLPLARLKIAQCEKQNMNWVERLRNISELEIDQAVSSKFDFMKLEKLKKVALPFNTAVANLCKSDLPLNTLTVWRFSGSLRDFSEVVRQNLEVLQITSTSGNVLDIAGVNTFSKLESLKLWNMRKLVDIDALIDCAKLKKLSIYSCKSINYKKVLNKLDTIEEIFFENQLLESLEYIPRNNLKRLILGENTIIEDGQVDVLLSFPKLEFVSYRNRRAYRYSAIEINEILEQRNS